MLQISDVMRKRFRKRLSPLKYQLFFYCIETFVETPHPTPEHIFLILNSSNCRLCSYYTETIAQKNPPIFYIQNARET
jgi:hypothetical protein